MSTGLCMGANVCSVKLVIKWIVDLNQYACDSLKVNHVKSDVRNESVENFLLLLKEWEHLCASCSLLKSNTLAHLLMKVGDDDVKGDDDGADDDRGSCDNDE
ncbi:hypothetical protein H5410_027556 [Solanum commersonii]|uniref:Uncharacterized protein n=1 Tax=Solanum commersonii TaxID=4109 RepID=A0A9J5Z275_SOLCO|nr:hypothetical protein H5410_027556 [Solanum commersonii]